MSQSTQLLAQPQQAPAALTAMLIKNKLLLYMYTELTEGITTMCTDISFNYRYQEVKLKAKYTHFYLDVIKYDTCR